MYIEKIRAWISQFSYTYVMMNMKLLAVVTSPSVHYGCSIWKTFWEEKFTGEEKFILGELKAVNIKNCDRHNVRKHIDIKDSDKYTTLDISIKFGSLDKMRITSSDPKGYLVKSVKGLITSLAFKAKSRPKKYKKERYAIGNVSMKNFSNIIGEF